MTLTADVSCFHLLQDEVVRIPEGTALLQRGYLLITETSSGLSVLDSRRKNTRLIHQSEIARLIAKGSLVTVADPPLLVLQTAA